MKNLITLLDLIKERILFLKQSNFHVILDQALN